MSHAQFKAILIDVVLTITGATTGVVSTVDNIEQGIRIVLGLLSIVSVTFLIAVNWEKATQQIKKWMR
jgi:hypothetical protein